MGEMIVSCYEIRQRLAQTAEEEEGGEGEDSSGGDIDFPQWVRNLIVVNHILIVANSSLNFAIYCKVRMSTEPKIRVVTWLGSFLPNFP